LYQRFSPQLFIGIGVLMFSTSSWMLSHLTLESGRSDIIVPLIVQGIAFAFLFVPLTTVALANIPRHQMADATGLSSLLRQIGGAIGLAIFSTLIGSYAVVARGGIEPHLTLTRPEVWQRMQALQQSFMARGYDAVSAKAAAMRVMGGSVIGQSMVLSFEHIFILAGALFLLVLPLTFLLRVPKAATTKPGADDVHVEI